ncbi:MAG TPA: helix-turn-helix transcriptional regulator [Longimicrobiales bacterium]|nr:helix-turn-helix transcriptional regulator [Longimicrobiales bacterium]
MSALQKQLGDLEELVLLAVLRLGDGAYGASIREELRAQAGRSVSISTVYVTLMRMEEKGLSRSWMGDPSGERGGKAKRNFQVTAQGLQALEASRAVRERMWSRVEQEGKAHAG